MNRKWLSWLGRRTPCGGIRQLWPGSLRRPICPLSDYLPSSGVGRAPVWPSQGKASWASGGLHWGGWRAYCRGTFLCHRQTEAGFPFLPGWSGLWDRSHRSPPSPQKRQASPEKKRGNVARLCVKVRGGLNFSSLLIILLTGALISFFPVQAEASHSLPHLS